MDVALDFNQVVREYEERIVRYLSSLLGDAALAQDLTQETFLRIHKGLDHLRSPEARTAWIYRIALIIRQAGLPGLPEMVLQAWFAG